MKNLFTVASIMLFTVALVMVGCVREKTDAELQEEHIKSNYKLEEYTYVPDSLRDDMLAWITETVKATNFRMTTSDYEDPEDVVVQCERTAKRLFERKTWTLKIYMDGYWTTVSPDMLNAKQLEILEKLKNKY